MARLLRKRWPALRISIGVLAALPKKMALMPVCRIWEMLCRPICLVPVQEISLTACKGRCRPAVLIRWMMLWPPPARRQTHSAQTDKQVILLSPAAASFDQFPSFEARGQHFCTGCCPHKPADNHNQPYIKYGGQPCLIVQTDRALASGGGQWIG